MNLNLDMIEVELFVSHLQSRDVTFWVRYESVAGKTLGFWLLRRFHDTEASYFSVTHFIYYAAVTQCNVSDVELFLQSKLF